MDDNKRKENIQDDEQGVIYGKNAVIEMLKSCESADTLYLSSDEGDKAYSYIVALAKEKGAVVKKLHPLKLASLCQSDKNQGVALMCSLCNYCTTQDILDFAQSKGEKPFIIISDGIEDPHNLGAVIRTAECAGAHGVIVPKRRGCGVNATVHKASAGACSHMKIARVTNIASEIKELKKRGVFIYCADMDGKLCYECDMTGATALVVGSEGFGVSHLTKELCDFVVSIPLSGEISSLNASVAAGVLMFEYVRQNRFGRK